MTVNRREFLAGAAAVAASLQPGLSTAASFPPPLAAGSPLPPTVRADFPWATREVFLNSAAYHPISVHSARAMEEYIGYRLAGAPSGLDDVGATGRGTGGAKQAAIKELFGRLINAKPTEIAFVQSTSDGESVVVAGMDMAKRGGNVVVDDLHYASAVYMYRRLERETDLEVRLVKNRDGVIDMADMERVVDGDTRLVSMALVSNINGYRHDVKAISDLAHAHGAYVYADVIQAAGNTPIDVKAIGLDLCACSSYKWLMGSRGFGFLYVREDLQESVVKPTRYGHRQVARFDLEENHWELEPGAAQYETGNVSNVGAACVYESLRYILNLGVENIRNHVRPLTDRLQQELPAMGYPALTPPRNESPIVVFRLPDPARTAADLARAGIATTVSQGDARIRISPSVFNTDHDIDRLIAAMRGSG